MADAVALEEVVIAEDPVDTVEEVDIAKESAYENAIEQIFS